MFPYQACSQPQISGKLAKAATMLGIVCFSDPSLALLSGQCNLTLSSWECQVSSCQVKFVLLPDLVHHHPQL